MRARLLGLIAVVAMSSCHARSSFDPECGVSADSLQMRYCIFRSPRPSGAVVYYLHGAGGTERQWLGSGFPLMIRSHWRDSGRPYPTVIGVSFGRRWLLTRRTDSGKGGLLEAFADRELPMLERELGQPPGRRIVVGVSMGGYNAAQLALHRPAVFSAAVLACPGILAPSPWWTDAQIERFARQDGGQVPYVKMILSMERDYFASEREWEKDAILQNAATYLGADTPRLFVTVGRQDRFGLFFGVQKFVEIAKSKGVNVTWAPVDGDHCGFDRSALIPFMDQI